MTMDRASLIADLKVSLHDAADVFTAAEDADFGRHLDNAVLDFSRARRRTLLGSLLLEANRFDYPAPANLLQVKFPLWGRDQRAARQTWDRNWPGTLPRLQLVEGAAGRELHLQPAPTAVQIADLGANYPFYYYAAHEIGLAAAATTVAAGDRGLLLLRAQAEAMKELALRNLGKPVAMRDGLSSQPRNGTPAALYGQLMAAFKEACS